MSLRHEVERILGSVPERRRETVEYGVPAAILEQVAEKYTRLVTTAEYRCANRYHRQRLIEDLCRVQCEEFDQLATILRVNLHRRLGRERGRAK